ncbi:MAG: hypothetical protein QM811_04190 [Pirellulales bacterium]
MVNRWLPYQVASCRLSRAPPSTKPAERTGSAISCKTLWRWSMRSPDAARAHLLTAAAHQFVEGDVQHWWHPPLGRGTRTRFSDDYLWLPLVVAQYVSVTGDRTVLDESAPFLTSPPLEPKEHERYELPTRSEESASLYEHCLRTLRRRVRTGPHGLPLMGCGDWNDGMNRDR